ncbi:MAG: DNA methyltransferase [Vicinamibacterales bacterium]|jgi:hypothetical protein|nr:DNA methyltransferase [Vicinamibacterales bacterium]|tara:strand:+ start:2638 stop:3801 length:1164 start_codon:yes stop_codon:yes gene_type:complete
MTETDCDGHSVSLETYTNEFWTSKQRAGNSLHEISYRACFKPQLVDFFVQRLTEPGEVVYDPFMGRGTTLVEAALRDRTVAGCDVNPLSRVLTKPRLAPPTLEQVSDRLHAIDLTDGVCDREGLDVFFHSDTLKTICALRSYLRKRQISGKMDTVDEWIEMVAVNRLTGHSRGFFSVYTLPPNQAVSIASQRKINARRGQTPPARDVVQLILKKSKSLLRDCDHATRRRLAGHAGGAQLLVRASSRTPELQSSSVHLVVTSPPFLDVVDYATDNWLRCWFCGIEADTVPITIARKLDTWRAAMTDVFAELRRVLVPGGHVAFEVGEVRGGAIKLEETAIPCGESVGLEPLAVVINSQTFTKTANCWGVSNNRKGTNTNRIVLFRKSN